MLQKRQRIRAEVSRAEFYTKEKWDLKKEKPPTEIKDIKMDREEVLKRPSKFKYTKQNYSLNIHNQFIKIIPFAMC